MNFVQGDLKILYIKKGSDYLPIGCLTSNSFEESSELINTTTRDNAGQNTSRPINQSYSISFEGLITQELSLASNITFQEIKQLKRNRTLIEWRIDDTYGNAEKGSGYLNTSSDAASIDEMVTFSCGITGYGIPIDEVISVYDAYALRVTTASALIGDADCQKLFIQSLI